MSHARVPHPGALAAQPILLIVIALFFTTASLLADVLLHLSVFAMTAMVCHELPGQFFNSVAEPELRDVAVIGRGAGSIACYRTFDASPMTFYEIDPVVVRIAANPNLFQFIAQCGRSVSMRLGDSRRQLREAVDG